MYYCYLRGKQYELMAVRESLDKIVQANITVVVEPVRMQVRDLESCINMTSEAGANLVLIVNPSVGELQSNNYEQEKLIKGLLSGTPNVELGILIDQKTSMSEINSVLLQYPLHNFTLIHEGEFIDLQGLQNVIQTPRISKNIFIADHCSSFYQNTIKHPSKPSILIKDSFKMQPTNAEYNNALIEYFSDLYCNFRVYGYDGFGDFSIVGDHYSEGGGQAKTAAIHLTYPEKNGNGIHIQHFLSDERIDYESVSILIDEALLKLKNFLTYERPDIMQWSSSCQTLVQIYDDGRNTNLANIKKLSISHHFELMHFLANSNAF